MAYQRPLQSYHVRREINIDIRYHKVHPNVVAEYEAMEAARFCNYNWGVFMRQPLYEQARCVAEFRTHHRIDAVVQQEIADHTKRKMNG